MPNPYMYDLILTGYHVLRQLQLEQRRIAVTLNLIECFLQDAPQFGLQVYIWTVQNRESSRALWNDFRTFLIKISVLLRL